ncbi:MAG: DUF1015 domain-containing protein, partial [Actinobacteria bacterium]
EHNVVELELAAGVLDATASGNRYETAEHTWNAWRESGVLLHDAAPAIYVLEQRFEHHGREVSRRAFIVAVGLEPLDAGVILPHERTLPKALGDRFELIKATGANFSQVFGLFDDPGCDTDGLFDVITATEPVATATDADGVKSTVWAHSDAGDALALAEFMEDRQIFIADGHHRYTTALAYRDLMRKQAAQAGGHPADPPYDYVMMALVNMDDPDLAVLPYHRIANADGVFDAAAFRAGLERHFDISELPDGHPSGALEGHDRPSFLIKTREDARPVLAVLRADVDPRTTISAAQSDAWKSLDVAVLQELVLWPLLGIHPDRAETLDRISFTKDAHAAFRATTDNDVAFVLRATRLDQLRSVSLAGETMPQKSTYFYPKLLSGLVFRDAR